MYTSELLVFYLLFEVMLLVMYLCIASYWYNTRAHHAVYLLVVYTVVGSALMASSMVLGYMYTGSLYYLGSIDSPLCTDPAAIYLPHRVYVLRACYHCC